MTNTFRAVTDENHPHADGFLPLHHRTVWKTVAYFYCAKCGSEGRFSWLYAHCTESGELLCLFHGLPTGWKLCRRCRQPRRTGREDSQFTGSQTVCDGCKGKINQYEPLQMVCVHCETGFTATRSDAKFCSAKCRTAAHRATQSKGVAQ